MLKIRLITKERYLLLSRKVGHEAHRWEHGFHLAYFGGLSTGFLDYHLIAGGCLVLGLLAMLPQGGAE
jgi:hypothetical protein